MLSVVFYIAALLLCIVILSLIPGINILFRPIIDGIGRLVPVLFISLSSYLLWFIKLIFKSHMDIVYHLTHKESKINYERMIDDEE